ncbi:MAG: helix-turn-helix domain-containing protein, partial [Clostridia bacterium]|nr:helix-turn-helix domain-containing protein [Clostridia bacterium]
MTETDIVNKNCFISNNTKKAIALSANKKTSEKDIANRLNVSHNTVNRIINSFNKDYKVNYNYLPEVLYFNEFKSTKTADGAMSFIYVDAMKHSIIDVVEDRRLNNLITYTVRNKIDVELVVDTF